MWVGFQQNDERNSSVKGGEGVVPHTAAPLPAQWSRND